MHAGIVEDRTWKGELNIYCQSGGWNGDHRVGVKETEDQQYNAKLYPTLTLFSVINILTMTTSVNFTKLNNYVKKRKTTFFSLADVQCSKPISKSKCSKPESINRKSRWLRVIIRGTVDNLGWKFVIV